MKQSLLILCCCLIFMGCNDQKSRKEIDEFRSALGAENVLELDNYLLAFENGLLKRKYPNTKLEDAYLKITSESVKNLRQTFNQYFEEQSRTKFLQSQLWDEIYAPADSVWIEDDDFVIRFIYYSTEGERPVSMSGERLPNPKDRDSVKTELLKWVDFNKEGKYITALNKIKNRNKFFERYVEDKNIFGVQTPGVLQYQIDQTKPDLNDSLNRIIIAIELSDVLNHFR